MAIKGKCFFYFHFLHNMKTNTISKGKTFVLVTEKQLPSLLKFPF